MARLYVPVDVNLPDDPKVVTAGPDAEHLYLRSLMLAKRIGGDGFIALSHLYRLCGDFTCVELDETTPQDLAALLVTAGLWIKVEGGFRITAWLSHNPSDDELQAKRDEERERKARWRQSHRDTNARDATVPTGHRVPATQRDAHERDARESESESESESEQKDTYVGSADLSLVEQSATTDPVNAVFDFWQTELNHPRAHLDEKRRRRIVWALKHYPLEDIHDAIRGCKASAYHQGQNDSGTVYDDLTLILRDATHVERFRALQRDVAPVPVDPVTVRVVGGVTQRWSPGAGWISEAV